MNKLVCSRFDSKIPDASKISKKTIHLNVNKKTKKREYHCVATNGHEIFDGVKYTLDQFFRINLKLQKTLLVLTDKEAFYLIRWCENFGLKVLSFETAFPIFDNIKFTSSIKKNYEELKLRLHYTKKIGLTHGTLMSTLCNRTEKIINRKLKNKTSYDEMFAYAYIPPYQETFKFFDFREKRLIISLDFNSMFAHCMKGEFLNPETIYYENIDAVISNNSDPIEIGLYHVVLKRPQSEFFQTHHPFNFTQLGLSLKFNAKNTSEIEVQLFNFELDYYKKFFDEVHIVSALRTITVSGHPLYSESLRLFKLRTKAKAVKNSALEKSYKLQLAMLHSATNRKAEKKFTCDSYTNLLSILNEKFHLTLDEHTPYLIKSSPLLKKIKIKDEDKNLTARLPDLNSPASIYSFSSQILAKSRLIVFQTLEALNNFEGLDICYVNTDSVHVSIPSNRREDFFKNYNDLIGSEIGKLKVQSLADKASWFDVGHYYLFKDGKVTQWANIGLNHKGNNQPFVNYRERYNRLRMDEGIALTKSKVTFMSSLSYRKRLSKPLKVVSKVVDYQRFSIDEIVGFDNAMLSILKEKQASYATKKELYDLLRLKSKK
tara:strand:- start:15107 stop:16909 length:1803 start_codon:yes stop_codon:yes gene_type:complete